MDEERLKKQVDFLVEVDKFKDIIREIYTINSAKGESDADHTWHMAIAASVLSEYAPEGTDISKVIKMVLIHDLVEIYAGDVFTFDFEADRKEKERKEREAANKLFKILPKDQAEEMISLWEEFEARISKEAKFAKAMDKFQSFLLDSHSPKKIWKIYNLTKDQMKKNNEPIKDCSKALWEFSEKFIDEEVKNA